MNLDEAINSANHAIREVRFTHEIDFCFMMVPIIEDVEVDEVGVLLKHISENFRKADSAGKKVLDEMIGLQKRQKLQDSYGDIVDGLLSLSLKGNPPEKEFYKRMGTSIANPIFDTKEAKAFCLYYQIIDPRLPYFELKDNPLRLADDEFERKTRALESQIGNMSHILAREFDQKTMEADNLLDVIESVSDREDKVILVVALVQILRAEYESLKRQISDLGR